MGDKPKGWAERAWEVLEALPDRVVLVWAVGVVGDEKQRRIEEAVIAAVEEARRIPQLEAEIDRLRAAVPGMRDAASAGEVAHAEPVSLLELSKMGVVKPRLRMLSLGPGVHDVIG